MYQNMKEVIIMKSKLKLKVELPSSVKGNSSFCHFPSLA